MFRKILPQHIIDLLRLLKLYFFASHWSIMHFNSFNRLDYSAVSNFQLYPYNNHILSPPPALPNKKQWEYWQHSKPLILVWEFPSMTFIYWHWTVVRFAKYLLSFAFQVQVNLLSKFLFIAKCCYEHRNFATTVQILRGLENLIVRQLPVSK